ncbi:right-handed parallel beta-helix repeat-containing protein [candidate division KSB1 bacterium]|nr:right-handed parallel beta-helix repeat-containing protein [candidate division KSB1 bacterium]
MKRITFLSGWMVNILSLSMITWSPAATYYVDRNHTTANDANPGTLNSPWKTIQHAASTAVAGDTVYIRAGIYNESVFFEHSGNAATGYILFSAYAGETPVIDGTNVDAGNGLVLVRSYIKLIGLEIRNWSGNAIWVEGGAAFFEINDCEVHDVFYGIGISDGAHDFALNRVTCHHFDLYGVDVSPSGSADCYNGVFNDCVSHTGRDPQQNVDGFALGHGTQHDFILNRCIAYGVYDGFDISSGKSTLNHCLAYNCGNGAYKLWQDEVYLYNCIGYNCGSSVAELDWDGNPGTTYLINCTFYDGKTYGVWVENPGDKLVMYNCIIAGGDNIGLAFEQMGVDNYRGDYNLFHNDDWRAVTVGYTNEFSLDDIAGGAWSAYSKQDSHSVVVKDGATLFVDPVLYDLHLSQSSPAIDQGTALMAPATDYDGIARPQGAGVDIGAYEYHSGSSVNQPGYGTSLPGTLQLWQNFPNPFNPVTEISYYLPERRMVALMVYNMHGQRVRTLIKKVVSAGEHRLTWDGLDVDNRPLPSGIYLCTLQTGPYRRSIRMALLK